MTPLHEIGFLVLSGALSCWTWNIENNPCPEGAKIKIAAYESTELSTKPTTYIERSSFQNYENSEVAYEESGLAVYQIAEQDWYQIQNKNGKLFWLHLPSLEKSFQQKSKSDQTNNNSWRFEKIETLISQGLVRVDGDYIKFLRQEDLKTPLIISDDLFAEVHEQQLKSRLKKTNSEIPISYVISSVNCTAKIISANTTKSSCTAPREIYAYENPNASSEPTKISMTWANWAGKLIKSNKDQQTEHLYIFAENNEWLKIYVNFGNKDKRWRWVKKSDLGTLPINPIPRKERVNILIDILESTNQRDSARILRELKPELGFSASGKTKWSTDGILWGEVYIQDNLPCSGEESKNLIKAWLPYKLNKKSQPLLSWYSRGC